MPKSYSPLSNRELDRYVSFPIDIVTGNRIELKESIDIVHALYTSTSNNQSALLVGLEAEKSCPILKDAWDRAQQHYVSANHRSFKQEELHEELHVALIAYVLESEFYKRLNKLLRKLKTVEEVRKYPYKNYYKLLILAIANVEGVPNKFPKHLKVYRGMEGRVKVGEMVCFQQFLSTSRRKDMAKKFAGRAGTVFVIHMSSGRATAKMLMTPSFPNGICLDHVYELLDMSPEYECLIWPFEGFQVTKIKEGANGRQYVYLKA